MRSEGAKGTLKKETGVIRWKRRDIARMLTVLNERKRSEKIVVIYKSKEFQVNDILGKKIKICVGFK